MKAYRIRIDNFDNGINIEKFFSTEDKAKEFFDDYRKGFSREELKDNTSWYFVAERKDGTFYAILEGIEIL